MSTVQAVAATEFSEKENEKKWTKAVLKAGWTVIPSILLDRQQAFGLDAIDMNILLHIVKHWWYADNLPFPSKSTIAKCMGINPRTVQRRVSKMEADGLIKRQVRRHPEHGQQTNIYSLKGLIKEATPYAIEFVAEKEKNRAERQSRYTRKALKKPALRLTSDPPAA